MGTNWFHYYRLHQHWDSYKWWCLWYSRVMGERRKLHSKSVVYQFTQ